MSIDTLTTSYESSVKKLNFLSGLAPLFFRLVLAPIMIIAGYNKLGLSNPDATFIQSLLADPNIVSWFANPDWGLGLPMPDVLAFLAGWTEFLGGWLLLLGLMTRLISIPLMITMVVAITTVHLDKGWFAIAPTSPSTSAAAPLAWLNIPGAKESLENSKEVKIRLDKMRSLVSENGNTDWLYAKGNIVVLNNGIEFAATYFIMLLSLFFSGGGRYTSLDYYLKHLVFK